jgi:hypothetical protein
MEGGRKLPEKKINAPHGDKPLGDQTPPGTVDNQSSASSPGHPISQPSIAKAVEAFIVEVDALADTLPVVMPLLLSSTRSAFTDYNDFLKRRAETNDGGLNYTVKPGLYSEYLNVARRRDRNKRALQIIPRSFFTSLVSHYDAFIGSLLRAVFYMKPEVLNSSERQISFKELTTFESIDAARESVVEAEVETLLRQSHADQFKWMEGRFNTPLRKDLPVWPSFIEVTERRNLFVHCNGVVSAQYLEVCKHHGVDCSKLKVGVELDVSDKYFKGAHATLVEIGVKLAHVLWRRLKPEEMMEADTSINNLCLDLIRDEKYAVAQTLLDFACGYKTFGSETIRRLLILNRAQSYKWAGQEKRAKEILLAEDWNAVNELLRLGAEVLRDDFKAAAQIMGHIGANGRPSESDYTEWPVFKVFRTSPEFAVAFREVFGKPFGEVTLGETPDRKVGGEDVIQ